MENCGEFEYLDEDIFLEKNGNYLINIHIILNVKTNLARINIVLHGKIQDPKNCSFYSKSWNIGNNIGILFNKTFLNKEIRENYYEAGYKILAHNKVKIEETEANIVPENNLSFRICDADLKECSGIEVDFNNELEAGKVYAMRIGFYIAPPQSKIRYIVNKMRYQIHYYTTFSINAADAVIINARKNHTIPVNPNNSVLFVLPAHDVEIEKPSITSSTHYEHYWKPLSTEKLEKPRVAYRWEPDKIRKTSDKIVTDSSIPLSFTFRHFNPAHHIGYFAFYLASVQFIRQIPNILQIPNIPLYYYFIFSILYFIIYVLINHTFTGKSK